MGEVPTIDAVWENRVRSRVQIQCPHCKEDHYHGCSYKEVDSVTHRLTHCIDRKHFAGYWIRMPA